MTGWSCRQDTDASRRSATSGLPVNGNSIRTSRLAPSGPAPPAATAGASARGRVSASGRTGSPSMATDEAVAAVDDDDYTWQVTNRQGKVTVALGPAASKLPTD